MQWHARGGITSNRLAVPLPRSTRFVTALAVALATLVAAAPSQAATPTLGFRAAADGAVSLSQPNAHFGRRGWLRVQGSTGWRSYLRFRVRGVNGPVTRATLLLHADGPLDAPLEVRVGLGRGWRERRLTGRGAPRVGARVALVRSAASCKRGRGCTVRVNLTRAIPGNGAYELVLVSRGRHDLRLASREAKRGYPQLRLRVGAAAAPAPRDAGGPPSAVSGIWTTAAELASRPMTGPAWQAVKAAADGSPGTAAIADQDSDHDVNTLAAALVYARTGGAAYRAKAAAAIGAAIGTEQGGRTLALGRNLPSYAIAADLIGLGAYDAALDARFRAWLSAVRTAPLDGLTLVQTHEQRPNNWGTMAGAARMAADVYLGDTADLDRASKVFAGWLGDRAAYAGFEWGDLSWQLDAKAPVGVLPAGATKDGMNVDGALPDDMRRGCSFSLTPCHTNYAWEAMQGVVVQAQILSRRGYDAWNWQDRAVLRAIAFLDRLDKQFGDWWASTDDEWQPWLINRAYGTGYKTIVAGGPGKIMGWTDWTAGH